MSYEWLLAGTTALLALECLRQEIRARNRREVCRLRAELRTKIAGKREKLRCEKGERLRTHASTESSEHEDLVVTGVSQGSQGLKGTGRRAGIAEATRQNAARARAIPVKIKHQLGYAKQD
jgi:hypothetical protein